MAFREELITFICEELVESDQKPEFSDDENLIQRGIIDSMSAIQLIAFIEDTLHVRIPNHEVKLENLRSVESIQALAGRLSG